MLDLHGSGAEFFEMSFKYRQVQLIMNNLGVCVEGRSYIGSRT